MINQNISPHQLNTQLMDLKISDFEEFRPWQERRRRELLNLLGWNCFKKVEPDVRILDTRKEKDCTIYDLTITCEPGVTMPFFLLAPPEAAIQYNCSFEGLSHYPAMIIPHGHLCDGRYGTVGISRHPEMDRMKEEYNSDLGRQFVQKGYITLCPDARGSGDRRQLKDREAQTLKGSECTDLNNALIGMGSCLAGAWTWDLMALIDWFTSLKREANLYACGFSGGGWQTLLLTALDERIKMAAVSGYFHQARDCVLTNNLCSCNFIPGFNSVFDHAELAALCAPRPLLIEKGMDDPLNGKRGINGVRELYAKAQVYYNECSAEGYVEFNEFKGGHYFNNKEIFSFFAKQ